MIHPTPWRISDAHGLCIVDANEDVVADSICEKVEVLDRPTAERIVRLFNAEPEIVAALEAAEEVLGASMPVPGSYKAQHLVRAALAKVRG